MRSSVPAHMGAFAQSVHIPTDQSERPEHGVIVFAIIKQWTRALTRYLQFGAMCERPAPILLGVGPGEQTPLRAPRLTAALRSVSIAASQ
jgi:hypothetical protein